MGAHLPHLTLIDHTSATAVIEFVDNFKRTGRGIATIVGLDKLRARSHSEAAMRISAPVLAQERSDALTELARVSLTHVSPWVDPYTYLERISLSHFGPIAGQDEHPITDAVIRGGTHLVRKAASMRTFVRNVFTRDEEYPATNHDTAWTSLSRSERVGAPTEMEKLSLSSDEHPRPVFGEDSSVASRCM